MERRQLLVVAAPAAAVGGGSRRGEALPRAPHPRRSADSLPPRLGVGAGRVSSPAAVALFLISCVAALAAQTAGQGPSRAPGDAPGAAAVSGAQGAAPSAPDAAACARFLASLYEPELGLLVEYPGSKVAWLSHDNVLAARALRRRSPRLARRLSDTLARSGRAPAGKLAPLLGLRAPEELREPRLVEVRTQGPWSVRTEEEAGPPLQGWRGYTDLLLFAAARELSDSPLTARELFREAMAAWDGTGFMDAATRSLGRYAAYKLALALWVGDRLREPVADRARMLAILGRLQTPQGGIVTDYDADLRPIGFPNAETTSLVLLALDGRR